MHRDISPPIDRRHRQFELADRQHRLLVGISSGLVEIEMRQGAERLHVQLLASRESIEASGHKVSSAIFLQEPALAHGDARRLRHQVIGILDGSITLWVFQLLVLVARHAVELQQPVIESVPRRDLPRAHLVRLAIPRDHRFGPRRVAQITFQFATMRQDFGRQPHQRSNLDLHRLARLRAQPRRELQRTHTARASVAEPLHGLEALGRAALRRQPGVDQRVAELVRQRIRQQPRQTVKHVSRQRGKFIHALAQRHRQRRNLNPAPGKRGIVLEGSVIPPFVHRDGPDRPPPDWTLAIMPAHPRSIFSTHLFVVAFRPEAR